MRTTQHHARRRARGAATLTAAALLAATLACTAQAGDKKPTPVSGGGAPVNAPPAYEVRNDPFMIPSSTPLPTAIPSPTTIPPTVYDCTPFTYWPAIVIQAGDTLAEIAVRVNSTVDQLAQANCLTDPGLIYAGQPLYVPQLPPTYTPSPTTTPAPTLNPQAPVFTQPLTVNQHWIRADGRPVTYYASVRVTVDVANNATHVNFFVNDPSGGPAIFIGQDADPWDGAWVDYNFAGPGAYTFQARAVNEYMELASNALTVIYDPNFTPPGEQQFNRLTIEPHVSDSGGWFQLQAGVTVTITWPHVPVGADRVEFRLKPTGSGPGDLGQLIGQDFDPSDGALATWPVPSGISAHVEAVAHMPDGSTQTSVAANVYAP